MEKILVKKSLPRWIKTLDSFSVYAPVKAEDMWNYEIVTDPGSLDLESVIPVQSPKKIIFPQREMFFSFSKSNEDGFEIKELSLEEKPPVILGVTPCDAKALTLTDKVFGGDFEDVYYWKRRKQAALVGLSCTTPPSPNCFCVSVEGAPDGKEGLDILMTDLGDRYFVEALTPKGEKLVHLGKDLFTEPQTKDKQEIKKIHTEAAKKLKRQIQNIKKIPPQLKKMFDSPFWDEEAMSCIRCGICTYLCPTCHCFDINDEITSLAPLEGKRVRTWDTCQFPDFTMHSSGHNPRPDRASRLRQRIFHKFQYFIERYESYQCTGCGRCITKCPVGIDIISVLDKVRDYGA